MLEKKILCLALITAIASGLTACGTTSSDASDTSGSSGEKTKIVYTTWADADEKKMTQDTIDNFEKLHPDIEVDLMAIPKTDYDEKITTMVSSNQQLDLAQLESATNAYPLAEDGQLTDLNDMFQSYTIANKDDYLPNAFYNYNDQIIGMYNGIEPMILFYSPEAFDKVGLPYPPQDPSAPWSWDEFVSVAQQLTFDSNGNNATSPDFDSSNITQYGVDVGKDWSVWGSFVDSNGGSYVTADNQFGLAEPEAYNAIQNVADLSNVYNVAPVPTVEKGLPGSDVALQTGQYAMVVAGQWNCLQMTQSGTDFGVAVLPAMGDTMVSQTVSGMLSILANSQNKEAAWELLVYLEDPSSNIEQYANGNLMPIQKSWLTDPDLISQWVDNDAHPDGYEEAVIGTLLNYSVPSPTGTVVNFNQIMEVVGPALDQVWSGDETAQQAMTGIEDQITPLLGGTRS